MRPPASGVLAPALRPAGGGGVLRRPQMAPPLPASAVLPCGPVMPWCWPLPLPPPLLPLPPPLPGACSR